MVHLPQQAAADVEEAERRCVRLRHVEPAQQLVAALVLDLAIDGLNQMVKKMPLRIRTMNEYSAISPRRNDQWSGNTLRKNGRPNPATPIRSSSHLVGPAASLKTARAPFGGLGLDCGLVIDRGGWLSHQLSPSSKSRES